MYEFLKDLDRRWIFLLMGVAVAVPVLFKLQFPEPRREQENDSQPTAIYSRHVLRCPSGKISSWH